MECKDPVTTKKSSGGALEYAWYSPEMNVIVVMAEPPRSENEDKPHRLHIYANDGTNVYDYEESYYYLGEV
jgi:hypothetical protein